MPRTSCIEDFIDPVQPTVHTFDDIEHDISRIHIGDSVVDLVSAEQIDGLVGSLARVRLSGLMPRSIRLSTSLNSIDYPKLSTNNGKKVMTGWHGGAKLPSQVLVPKKINGRTFNGKLVDTSVTLLGEDITRSEASGGRHLDHRQPQQVLMLLQAGLHTTGRGIIGRAAKLVTVEQPAGRFYKIPNYVDLGGDNLDEAFEQLLADSEQVAKKITVNGLRKAYSAGLPSLGKRH